MHDLVLSPEEVCKLSGGYVQPASQLRALLKLGYFRARRSAVTGAVIVERAHYEAVAGGHTKPDARQQRQPELRSA